MAEDRRLEGSLTDIAAHRPRLGSRRAEETLLNLYGIRGSASPLPSDRDLNYRIAAGDGSQFVLKISSSIERREVLEAQNEAMRRVAVHVSVPKVIHTMGNTSIGIAEEDEGREHFIRLLAYLPGVPMAKVHPHRPGLMKSLGRFMGSVSRGLAGFDHPGAHRDLIWDLARAGETVRDRLHYLDESQNSLVQQFLVYFEAHVEPLIPRLRHSVTYHDANDYNVLVNGPEHADREVVALVDFGDLLYSITAADVSIAAAYAMLDAPDPLRTAADLIAAYHVVFDLREEELEAIFPLITMRLCASVCICADQQRQEPGNDYLRISNAPAWRLLSRLKNIHPRFAQYVIRSACGLEAYPHSEQWTAWARNRDFHPVVQSSDTCILDFSTESSDWSVEDLTQPGRAAATISRRLAGRTGIGAYGEARLVYGGEQFVTDSGRRTIHIGVDLFRDAGSAVFAPLDGVVHSLADNDRPFDYGPTVILEHTSEDGPHFYTLYGHLSRSSLAGLAQGASVGAGEVFASIGSIEANGGWTPHLHFQVILDMLDRRGDFPGVAASWQRDVWKSICPDPSPLLGLQSSDRVESDAALISRRSELLGPSLSLSYSTPLVVARGYRHFLYDRDGHALLDTVNNVAHVGHCHPRVVDAASRRMRVLNTNTRFVYKELIEYAERLIDKLPAPLRVCYFVNSGSEANDLALRLARSVTGRRDVVVLDHAYHGNLTSLIDVSPYKFNGAGGGGKPPHTHVVPIPDPFRGIHRGEDSGSGYVSLVEGAFETAQAGAFLSESAVSCGGQVFLPKGFLEGAYRIARGRGAVCIADEVQTGFGRFGDHFWAFESHGVVPDIVTMGKPMGNGHPLGAVVTTPDIARAFDPGMEYFNTFGGNPVSCAVGLAVMDVLHEEELQGRAKEVGDYFIDSLGRLSMQHAIIGDVRGSGLFIGVELVRSRDDLAPATEETRYVVERMREKGILASLDGPYHNVLKIKPPMVFDRDAVDQFVSTLDEIMSEDFVRARLY